MTSCTSYRNVIQVRVTGTRYTNLGEGTNRFNASREVAGLLGVTVVGAVLRSSESAALRSGTRPAQAFIDGYHSGLWLTIGLLAAGVVLSYLTLRPRLQPADLQATDLQAAELGLAELVLGEPLEPLGDMARGSDQAPSADTDIQDSSGLPHPGRR